MAMKTAFVVQPFEIHRKRLRPARQEPAQTESGAVKKAENLAKRMPGAAALKVVADDETGELEGVTILGQWGEIPDDFAESLQGGQDPARNRLYGGAWISRRPTAPVRPGGPGTSFTRPRGFPAFRLTRRGGLGMIR